MATATDSRVATESLSGLHWAGAALAVVSGVIHLVLGAVSLLGGDVGFGVAFLLAGIAFLVAVGLLVIDYRRPVLYAVGVPFTAVQILAWYWLNYGSTGRSLGSVGGIEIADKLAQVLLIVVLVVLYRREA
ncbi:DUF7475 family protein [Salinirubrum litoreum]|uniref:Uncharacterized protein n=1 Tax=Salinirubrum litoreum TaxID=1126234 RepID=A0ABD5R9H4_9EURY|nr:hypothetical protein [Salinirubrum litoreum]